MTGGGPMDLRMLLLVVSASAVFTVLGPAIYRRDPARRRLFLAALAAVLLVAPWWSAAGLWTWPLGLPDPSLEILGRGVPWLALGVWWAVGVLLISRTVVQVQRGRQALRQLPRLDGHAVEAECRQLAGRLGLSRPVELRVGLSPCASSLGGPVLVLPAAILDWPATSRSAVLSHELAHLRRRDDGLMLLIRLLTDWYWWMPWLRRLQRRYVEAMEESCDDLASSLLPTREDYVSGLVRAARRLGTAPAASATAWVSLLGHSHLAVRVQRLLTVPPPRLHHTDGRWTLLWASLVFTAALTAEPSTIPDRIPGSARLLPLQTAVEAEPRAAAPEYSRIRVVTESSVRDPRTGRWRPVPDSARDPLPVYPARALAQGLEGHVTVELRMQPTRFGAVPLAPPTLTSSDSTGVLSAAVERALAHHGARPGAGFRTVSGYDGGIPSPPPGTPVRLKKTYRFELD